MGGFEDIVCGRCKEKMINCEKENETCKNILRLFYEIFNFNKPHPNFEFFLKNFEENKKILEEEIARFYSRLIEDLENGVLTLQKMIKDSFFKERKISHSRLEITNLEENKKEKIIELLENSLEDLKKTLSLKDFLMEDLQKELNTVRKNLKISQKNERIKELEKLLEEKSRKKKKLDNQKSSTVL